MTTAPQQQQRMPDPRQSAMSRAMYGIQWVTVAQRNKIITDARQRYMRAVKAQRAAQRRAGR